MTKMNNDQIIKAVVNEMGEDVKQHAEGKSGVELLSVFDDFPNVKNAFVNTLTNKITKSVIFSKIFNNPLKELKKGKLEYGESIEELFVQMAMSKNFGESWEISGTPEGDLIRKLKPKVTAMYISVNFDKKYKTTVFDKQLRKAFINEYGLSNLVMQIVGSITSQAEYQEFLATKQTMLSLVSECKNKGLDADHKIESDTAIPIGKVVKQTPYVVNTPTAKDLLKAIRTEVGNMKFPSTKYNLAKELNWSNPQDLMLMTTSETIADIDVNVLAGAFNVSMTDINTRTILVDEMPKGIFQKESTPLVDKAPVDLASSNTVECDTTKKPVAILFDKDLLQIWDTYQATGTFYNAEGNYTNHFANREGIFAVCSFANMVVFYK